MSCGKCLNAYDAINNNHRKCFTKVKGNRSIPHFSNSIHDGGDNTLIGYSALDAKNYEFTLYLLKDEDLKNEQSQLGFNCLYEALLYNNKFYYDLFLKKGLPPINEHELTSIIQKYGLTNFLKKEDKENFIFEKEDMNW